MNDFNKHLLTTSKKFIYVGLDGIGRNAIFTNFKEVKSTMTKTINYMTTEQCFQLFQTDEMQKVYEVELASVDAEDIGSVQRFLDEEAYDVMRLDRSQCGLLNLDYETGYYVDTWKGQYLS